MAVTASAGLNVSRLWALDRYARYVSQTGSQVLFTNADRNGGKWEHFGRKENPNLKLCLVESNHLMVTSGNQVLESFILWQTEDWMKAVAKGDSMLFIYKQKEQNRRFRVKLAPLSHQVSSVDVCNMVVASLRQFITIQQINEDSEEIGTLSQSFLQQDSQRASNNSQLMSYSQQSGLSVSRSTQRNAKEQAKETVSLGHELTNQSSSFLYQSRQSQAPQSSGCQSSGEHLANDMQQDSSPLDCAEGRSNPMDTGEQLTQQQESGPCITLESVAHDILLPEPRLSLGRAYADTHLPTEQLSSFIRLCLTDPDFPAFVEAVEAELNKI